MSRRKAVVRQDHTELAESAALATFVEFPSFAKSPQAQVLPSIDQIRIRENTVQPEPGPDHEALGASPGEALTKQRKRLKSSI